MTNIRASIAVTIALFLTVLLSPAAIAAPTPAEGPAVSKGVDWAPDHVITCDIYPGRTYDILTAGVWKIQTTGTGECTDRPEFARSVLYLKHWVGFGWEDYAVPNSLLNPGTRWFHKATSTWCKSGFYRSYMTFYGEHGNPIKLSQWGPTAGITCGSGKLGPAPPEASAGVDW